MLSSDTAHLTLPSLRDGPSLSPRKRAERGHVPRTKCPGEHVCMP